MERRKLAIVDNYFNYGFLAKQLTIDLPQNTSVPRNTGWKSRL